MRQSGVVTVGAGEAKEVWGARPTATAEQVAPESLHSAGNGEPSRAVPWRAVL